MAHPARLVAVVAIATTVVVAGCTNDGSDGDARESTTSSSSAARTRTGCGRTPAATPGTERLTIEWEGGGREVERVVPAGYDGTTPHPLILNLHGFTSTIEQQNLFSDLPQEADARGYILLTPQAAPATLPIGGEEIRAPFWNIDPSEASAIPDAQDDVGFLTELVDSTATQLCVDEDRIYVTGNSNGAGMSAALACEMQGRLAAIAPVSGINLAPECEDLDPVSVIAFHGDADPLVPYEGGTAANVETGDPSVEDRVREFAQVAECAADPELTKPFPDIEIRRWTGCRDGTAVELTTVLGGGHTWPGMLNYVDVAQLAAIADNQRLTQAADVDVAKVAGHMTTNVEATTAMLDFFDAHRRA